MGITTYWDNTFKVKSLVPTTTSSNSIDSGAQLTNGAEIALEVSEETKSIVFIPEEIGVSKKVSISLKSRGSLVYQPGLLNVDLGGNVEIPLQEIEEIKIENISGGTIELYFMLLKEA